jgi:hypothetical protein
MLKTFFFVPDKARTFYNGKYLKTSLIVASKVKDITGGALMCLTLKHYNSMKNFQATNNLSYFVPKSLTKKKVLKTLRPGVNVIKKLLQTTRPNKQECLYLAITFQSSLTFAGNTRSLPKKEASERSSNLVWSGLALKFKDLTGKGV